MDWLGSTQFCFSSTGQKTHGFAVKLLHTSWPCVSSGPHVHVMFSSNTKKIHEEKLKMNFVMIFFFNSSEYYFISLDARDAGLITKGFVLIGVSSALFI